MGGFWQINVVYESNDSSTLTITVPENCTTKEFYDVLNKHPDAPNVINFELFSDDGGKRKSLTINSTERLSNYDITDNSTLILIACGYDRHWPSIEEIESISRTPQPAEGITITTISDDNPDVFDIEFDGPAVVMRCGHSVAPTSLALYCHSELERGKSEIRCPQCNEKWKFALLKPAACLTSNEITEFEAKAQINYFRGLQGEMKLCPKCDIFCTPNRNTDKRLVCTNCSSNTGKTYEFCWICLQEWKSYGTEMCGNPDCGSLANMFEILETCEETKYKYCRVKAPTKRACPNCTVLIHHDGGCKHMTCQNCKYEFCFICLKKYVKGSTVVYNACPVAPLQTQGTVGIVPGICESVQQEHDIWESEHEEFRVWGFEHEEHDILELEQVEHGIFGSGHEDCRMGELELEEHGILEPEQEQYGILEPEQEQHGILEPEQEQHGILEPEQEQHGILEPIRQEHDTCQSLQQEQSTCKSDRQQHNICEPAPNSSQWRCAIQ